MKWFVIGIVLISCETFGRELVAEHRVDMRPKNHPPKASRELDRQILPKIIGGKDSDPLEYPAMAALIHSEYPDAFDGQFGAAVLIHPYWVLTAGHCVFGSRPDQIDVLLGAQDLTNFSGHEQRIAAAELILHPKYDDYTLENDIALIRLSEPANPEFIPIPLIDDPSLDAAGIMARVIGWGMTDNNYTFPSILQEVDLPLVDWQIANQSEYLNGIVTSNMLAAGFASGGKDSASGDSGGPLMVPSSDGNTFMLGGIVSFGPSEGAALPAGYGIYTRVYNYRSFIFTYVMPGYGPWEIAQGAVGRYRDLDGDGRDNWAEFAFGSDPWIADSVSQKVDQSSQCNTLRFLSPTDITAVDYTLLYTPVLGEPFIPIGSSELIVQTDPADAKTAWITMQDPNPTATRGIIRFRHI